MATATATFGTRRNVRIADTATATGTPPNPVWSPVALRDPLTTHWDFPAPAPLQVQTDPRVGGDNAPETACKAQEGPLPLGAGCRYGSGSGGAFWALRREGV